MALGMEVGLSPGDCVLAGDPASLPLKGHIPPNFRPMSVVAKRLDGLRWHLVCVRLGPSYLQIKGHTHHNPVFGPCLLWPNGWMDEDATWYGSRPRPRPHCIRRGPSSARNGHSSPPSFRPVFIVATVAHLSYCWALVLHFNRTHLLMRFDYEIVVDSCTGCSMVRCEIHSTT